MTIRRFIFSDFWRKLVALGFAVIIYWQVGESVKRAEARRVSGVSAGHAAGVSAKASSAGIRDMIFPVGLLDGGAERLVSFAPGVEPKVKVRLRTTDKVASDALESELRFYVDAGELTSGKDTLPVRCHVRRPGVEVISVDPAEIRMTIVENTVKKP